MNNPGRPKNVWHNISRWMISIRINPTITGMSKTMSNNSLKITSFNRLYIKISQENNMV
jgi:hypothetical protein